jgi:hypothetical protein
MKSTALSAGHARVLHWRARPAAVLTSQRVRRIAACAPILLGVIGFALWLTGSALLVSALVSWWADLEVSAMQTGLSAYLERALPR